MSKAMVEFDQWIVCPKCESAMVGEVGEECCICHVECVATPLYSAEGEGLLTDEELAFEMGL